MDASYRGRPTLLTIMGRVRRLINDPVSDTMVFLDDAIQDALDLHRTERRWIQLRPQPTFFPGGQILYLDYYADSENWEDDVVLQDMAYNTITPEVSENLVGHWHFASQPNGIGVRATGKTYDVYGTAADLLETWAAKVKLDFDFSTDRDTFSRTQKFQMLTELAREYRKRAQPQIARMVQSDAAPLDDGDGVVYPSLRVLDGGW